MGDSTVDMRLAELSPSCGLWPGTEDALLDEISQTKSCRESGSQAGSGWGSSPGRGAEELHLAAPRSDSLRGPGSSQEQRRQSQGWGQGHHSVPSGTDQVTKAELQGLPAQGQEGG